jgi:hypothetical protein
VGGLARTRRYQLPVRVFLVATAADRALGSASRSLALSPAAGAPDQCDLRHACLAAASDPVWVWPPAAGQVGDGPVAASTAGQGHRVFKPSGVHRVDQAQQGLRRVRVGIGQRVRLGGQVLVELAHRDERPHPGLLQERLGGVAGQRRPGTS